MGLNIRKHGMRFWALTFVSALLVACGSSTKAIHSEVVEEMPIQRSVAITFDDLPSVGLRSLDSKQKLTQDLLEKLVTAKVPAMGFVNEAKLGKKSPKQENIALLQAWVDAGMELGNHTHSHPKFFKTPLEEYKQQVLLGERVTKTLFTPAEGDVRYFRHPYLNTGPDMETRRAFEQFLVEQNYRVAPVTIDNSEWVYAKAYSVASESGDADLQKTIGQAYVRHMLVQFEFYEQLSRDLFGREPAQVLLLHANPLNADYLHQLLAAIAGRGYRFVSMREALKDPAYSHVDNYTGSSGPSWLQRWWVSEGNARRQEPEAEQWVQKLAFADK